MRFLLDENFPLSLYERLRSRGIDCEHLIASGERGMPDSQIRQRLAAEDDLVLLTQDTEFETLPPGGGRAIISRVPQGLPIERRLELWMDALEQFVESAPEGQVFEILPSAELRSLPSESA